MSSNQPTYSLSKSQQTITSPDGQVFHAKAVLAGDVDCDGCHFKSYGMCPDTGLGRFSACAPVSREDKQTIVWQESP